MSGNWRHNAVGLEDEKQREAHSMQKNNPAKIPPPSPVLRELRRHLLLKITSGEKRIGDPEEIKVWMLKEYQRNPCAGDVFRAILRIREDLVVAPHELPSLEQSKRALYALEKSPLPEFCFVSSSMGGDTCGVLMQRESLEVGGLVYAVTIFRLQELTDKVARLEIRACCAEPEPFASMLTESGYVHIPKEEIHNEPHGAFALQCLAAYHNYKYPKIRADQILVDTSLQPKSNEAFVRLLADAYLGKAICTKAIVPLEVIKPRDIDHALRIPEEKITAFMPRAAEWGKPSIQLLLYEEEGELVMDDDYLAYLSYRALKVERVPVVIVGHFTQSCVEILEDGHGELIPPPVIARVNPKRPPATVSKQKLLQRKLLRLTPTISPAAHFEARFIEFCRLLSNSSTLEKDLHRYIRSNPAILDCHFASLFSEVPIGRYRADLVLQYEQTDKRIVLIELERHSHHIFTRSNRLQNKITHASQQVEDWIGEIRAGASNIPNWLKTSYTAEGAVVIGRSSHLTQEQKDLLFTINSNRLVKIITYDDLLERMMRLIIMLDQ
jgi:hypothetical protein